MAEVINMPRLSDTMEEGTVATWFKKVGDTVKEGDILAEIETDKATMEFEAFYEGELLHIGIEEGQTAPVDTLLAIIGEKGEDVSAHLGGGTAPVAEEVTASEAAPAQAEVAAAPTLPDNVEVITMPRLSDTMEEGTVASWLKKVGDTVNEGDILAEIETDKATMEFEAFYNGTLLHIGIQEGDSAPVDSLLAIIGDKDANVEQAIAAATASVSAPVEEVEKAAPAAPAVAAPVAAPVASPVAAPVAVQNTSGRIIASPLAKRLAEERGIQLATVQGSGDGGRIIKRDIENYQASGSVAFAAPQGIESVEEMANSQMRKTIAKRLGASKFTAPHYYLGVEFDMENAMAFRKQYNAIPDTKISFNDIVVKATALALKQHPQVNSRWYDDKIVKHHHVHMGVAVAVDDGLVVPVVKFADELPLPQIGAQVKDFAGRARDKKLTPAEMDGSTFTISNLGMFGIETFTSIINQPNSAILSVGAIVEKPVVKNGQIVVGHTMKLTLACDHRSVDGATGSLFLQTLKSYIENPITMLV
ncbi:MAG: 2-oxo acid dehydrogenase subunit E2 [Flavobacteriaceae bacterium]|nr:2-oxo acid dehydrogenase subunit E2 [Flavobacteriaceae bacterium]